MMGKEAAVYFQDATVGPQLFLSVLIRGFFIKLPYLGYILVVAGPYKFMNLSLDRCSIKIRIYCQTWERLLRAAEWVFLGVVTP